MVSGSVTHTNVAPQPKLAECGYGGLTRLFIDQVPAIDLLVALWLAVVLNLQVACRDLLPDEPHYLFASSKTPTWEEFMAQM
jgi:hypothetical protein